MRDYYQGKNEEIAETVRLYESGLTIFEIADRLGHHYQTISNYLHRRGIQIRPPYRQWEQSKIDDSIRLYRDGLTMSEIAKKVGGKSTTVGKYLRQAGISLRDKSYYATGKRNHSWKGGRHRVKGYIYVYAPDHPYRTKSNRVSEHRLVMEQKLGRYLLPTEVVDHINGITDNNRPENLRVFASNGEHLRATLKGRCPKWSEDGKRRISESTRRMNLTRRQSRSLSQQTTGAER